MKFTRTNPSPRYLQLQDLYREMHQHGESARGLSAEQVYPGRSLLPQVHRIKRLIELTGADTILDYGSGKGLQYEPRLVEDDRGGQWPGILDYWDVEEVVCYDPCHAPYSKLPTEVFDGVIATDVLEHCPEEDMSWIIEEIFGYARKFVFANIACYPALAVLPNGENAHCTIKPVQWWIDRMGVAAAASPGLRWEAWVQTQSAPGQRITEQRIGNA